MMKFVSAKYDQFGGIIAVGDDGENYHLRPTCDVSPWPEYIAEGGTIDPADPIVEPVPATISDRQFAQQLATMGLITKVEALEWVKAGVVPDAFDAFVQSLPEDERFDAEMLLSGATQFNRDHQLTETFGAARGMTPAQIDQLWRDAADL